MKSASDRWQEIAVLNNLKFEFKSLGKENDIPILVAPDYFKFPDLVREFFLNGYWWDNYSDDNVRPGKSFLIHDEVVQWFVTPFIHSMAPLFGLKHFYSECAFGNCFNGDMSIIDPLSAFPHTDAPHGIQKDAHIAMNIPLVESNYPMQTGFWSFNGKKNSLDMSHNDKIDLQRSQKQIAKDVMTDNAKWFQIEDYGPWKLEDKSNMVYNEMTCYPTFFFHNPYIKTDWFTDSDRITISSFLNTSPENLDFKEDNIDDISFAWEHFHLDKLHDYHPKKTTALM